MKIEKSFDSVSLAPASVSAGVGREPWGDPGRLSRGKLHRGQAATFTFLVHDMFLL